jgi:DNA polymerase-1
MEHDEAMIEVFKNNLVIHSATAAKVYRIPLLEFTGEQRRNAKAVNFGIFTG